MSISDDDYLDCILAAADDIIEPRPTPELLGAVESPTSDALGAEGMAPREGSSGVRRNGEGLCQGPPLGLLMTAFVDYLCPGLLSPRLKY